MSMIVYQTQKVDTPSVVSSRNSWKLNHNDYICIGIV